MADTANFRSSNLAAGSYDPQTREMTITFNSGDTYVYTNVPPDVWAGLKSSPSPGKYFFRQVRNLYSYEAQ